MWRSGSWITVHCEVLLWGCPLPLLFFLRSLRHESFFRTYWILQADRDRLLVAQRLSVVCLELRSRESESIYISCSWIHLSDFALKLWLLWPPLPPCKSPLGASERDHRNVNGSHSFGKLQQSLANCAPTISSNSADHLGWRTKQAMNSGQISNPHENETKKKKKMKKLLGIPVMRCENLTRIGPELLEYVVSFSEWLLYSAIRFESSLEAFNGLIKYLVLKIRAP